MGKLVVSYNKIDSQISKLQDLCEAGQYINRSIANIEKNVFSVTNSDTSDELIKSVSKYKAIHNGIMTITSSTISALEKAKFVYQNMDYTSDGSLSDSEE